MKRFGWVLIYFLIIYSYTVPQQSNWIYLGRPPDAITIRDIFEIPYENVILACGSTSLGSAVWQSNDSGNSWIKIASGYSEFIHFKWDSLHRRIWVLSDDPYYSLLYIDSSGINLVPNPPSPYLICGKAIEIIDNYLYWGGSIYKGNLPFSILLYRLNLTSFEWELFTQYIQCRSIAFLKSYYDRLLVFAVDKDNNSIRVFHHQESELKK